jgi:hypothetical protein
MGLMEKDFILITPMQAAVVHVAKASAYNVDIN